MSDLMRIALRNVGMSWLVSEIKSTNKLIHEGEQLLRGASPTDAIELRKLIRESREDVKVMTEELNRRRGAL